MTLENITIEYLKQQFSKASTNGTFRLWANTFIQKKFNVDSQAACFVMNSLLN